MSRLKKGLPPKIHYRIVFEAITYSHTTRWRRIGTTSLTLPSDTISFQGLVRRVCGLFAADPPPGLIDRLKEIDGRIEEISPEYKKWNKIKDMLAMKLPKPSSISNKLRKERNETNKDSNRISVL